MTDELAAIEALRARSWVEDAHGEVVLLSDAEDSLHAEQEARARVEAALGELRETLETIALATSDAPDAVGLKWRTALRAVLRRADPATPEPER